MQRLRDWSTAGTVGGNHLWMQISHAGRQSPWYVTREPLAPSAVQLDLLGNYAKPRALREDEIVDFIERFARVAATARATGFTGVQIHRSEEHTSELQSLMRISYAVFCLKKKTTTQYKYTT